MILTKEQKNKEQISTFLAYNNINPEGAMGFKKFETQAKMTQHDFHFNDDDETLTITSNESTKDNEEYKIVIHSLYLDF